MGKLPILSQIHPCVMIDWTHNPIFFAQNLKVLVELVSLAVLHLVNSESLRLLQPARPVCR